MSNCSKSIDRIFSKKVIEELLDKGYSEVYDYVIKRYTVNSDLKTNGDLISEIYGCMGEEHRNEYYYTNTLLNKLLVGIHSVNTTTALSQVRVADHIADFVMINGTGSVYEIKSDLDNLERLNEQIMDYYKAFSNVSVLASENEFEHVEHKVKKLGEMGESVGIYVLSEKEKIFTQEMTRKPKMWNEDLNHKTLFNLMRKKEYESVIFNFFGALPKAQPVFYYKECLSRFMEIPILDAQKKVFIELKKRNYITKKLIQSVPKELKSLVYFSNLSKRVPELMQFLQQSYRGR